MLRQQQTAEETNRFARKKEGKRSEKGRVSQLPVGSENSAFCSGILAHCFGWIRETIYSKVIAGV